MTGDGDQFDRADACLCLDVLHSISFGETGQERGGIFCKWDRVRVGVVAFICTYGHGIVYCVS